MRAIRNREPLKIPCNLLSASVQVHLQGREREQIFGKTRAKKSRSCVGSVLLRGLKIKGTANYNLVCCIYIYTTIYTLLYIHYYIYTIIYTLSYIHYHIYYYIYTIIYTLSYIHYYIHYYIYTIIYITIYTLSYIHYHIHYYIYTIIYICTTIFI